MKEKEILKAVAPKVMIGDPIIANGDLVVPKLHKPSNPPGLRPIEVSGIDSKGNEGGSKETVSQTPASDTDKTK